MSKCACVSSVGSVIDGAILSAIYLFAWELVRQSRRSSYYELNYWEERRARAKIEQEMKKMAQEQLTSGDGFFVQPIGHIESCFRQALGAPRQGSLVPSSRSALVLTPNMSPEALDGLEEFSHVWLTYKPTFNSDDKEDRCLSGKSVSVLSKAADHLIVSTVSTVEERKRGVLATRSAARLNPVVITLVRIEVVDKKNRKVVLSSCDLINGTPVLDMKPYVPAYDTVPSAKSPAWIVDEIQVRNKVTIPTEIQQKVVDIQKKLKMFRNDPQLYLKALAETLMVMEFTTSAAAQAASNTVTSSNSSIIIEFPFDETIATLSLQEGGKAVEVLDIVRTSKYNPSSSNAEEPVLQ